ncbi:MAG: iron-containing alcohol dehydrogenase, partial [Thermoanaerobaculia bacterium]
MGATVITQSPMEPTMRFEFASATRIIFGAGALREIGAIAKAFGTRALVVTGKSTNRAQPLLGMLESAGLFPLVFPIEGEPAIDSVVRGVQSARENQCDLVIGFGGGSPIDAGKAIAALMTNDG